MFGLFKKSFISSGLINGFVDVHCHVLPGVDDGIQKMVQQNEPDFRLEDIPMDDPAVYEMLTNGKTSGVFQMEQPRQPAPTPRRTKETIQR